MDGLAYRSSLDLPPLSLPALGGVIYPFFKNLSQSLKSVHLVEQGSQKILVGQALL